MLKTSIIAHRGASHDAPENTLASVRLAWEQGADAVEIDVQRSKDGHVVVIHDDSTRRTAGVARKVSRQSLSELQSLDAGGWKHPRWTGERIPSLRQVLACVPRGRRLLVEIKCDPNSIPSFVQDLRQSTLAAQQVIPIGFELETMRWVKQALPQLEVCWVSDFRRTLRGWSPRAGRLIEQATQAGLDGLDVNGRGPVDATFVREVHEAGLKLYIWTVDSPARARQLIAAGVDGITTNKPGWLRAQLVASGSTAVNRR